MIDSATNPKANETQTEFALRFHESMRDTIPSTDDRNRACFAAWDRTYGSVDQTMQAAKRMFPSGEYRCCTDVPLFAEHSTVDKRGNFVVYDRAALAAICDRCNERIIDTGNYVPITEGHTPDKTAVEKGASQPEVLGYAGPFRLGMIGNVKPRFCIFGTEWHHASDVPKLSKMRRRSPEIWLEEKMKDRFFDPIAALGAETPRLDMGMSRFSRHYLSDGVEVDKYSAAAPSATNVFVATENYETGGQSMAISPDDVQQIVQALMDTEPMQWVQQQMNDGPTSTSDETDLNDVADQMEADQDDDDDYGDMMPSDEDRMQMQADPMMDDEMMPEPDDDPMQMQADPMMDDEMMPADDDVDDEDVAQMARYMSGELSEDDMAQYRAKRYGANIDPDKNKPVATSDVQEKVDSYRRRRSRRERAKQDRYSRLAAQNRQLSQRIKRVEWQRTVANRTAELTDIARYKMMDLEKEIQRCSRMSDAIYRDHLAVINDNYPSTPMSIPTLYAPPLARTNDANADRYSKAVVDRAIAHVESERQHGRTVTWDAALDHVSRN